MNIYLIRHSDAEGLSKGLKDFERKLTPEGEIKIRNNFISISTRIANCKNHWLGL